MSIHAARELADFSLVILGAVLFAQGIAMVVGHFRRDPGELHWTVGALLSAAGVLQVWLGSNGWWSAP